MQIDLKPAADLTPEEADALATLRATVYPPVALANSPARHVSWAAPQWRILVRDDTGRLVAHVGVSNRAGRLDGEPVSIGGIGGVQTDPARRGAGHASAAMGRAAVFLGEELGLSFALLGCQEPLIPFYARLGWRPFEGTILVEQPDGTVPFTANRPMVLPLRNLAPATGTIDLCGLPW